MRFVTYADDDGDRVGVLHDDQVHPLGRGVTMLGLLRDGTLRSAGEQALAAPAATRAVGAAPTPRST
ncbi:hypothetical protein ABZ322_33770 [Streptomyces sp. NPDC006129]|uniref:hypothetical protein n=1 Tax=unclassified Streptomyces TaxID=2593676 RepID=UPI0033AC037D